MSKLKQRDGKLIVTGGGKVATACVAGCLVTFSGFGSCLAVCPALSAIAGVPFLVPPAACVLVSPPYVCFEVWDPTAVNCGFQAFNYVYIIVEANSAAGNNINIRAWLTVTTATPPSGTVLQICSASGSYADPRTLNNVSCPSDVVTVDFL